MLNTLTGLRVVHVRMPLSLFRTIFLSNDVIIKSSCGKSTVDALPGDHYQFQEVYAMKKSQLVAAYERQQKEIMDLFMDLSLKQSARVATRNMAAMSRQKKLDKMDIIEPKARNCKSRPFDFNQLVRQALIFQAKDLQIGYDRPLTEAAHEKRTKIC